MSGGLSRSGSQRRAVVAASVLGAAAVALPRLANAGTQVEEPLADAVRSVLAAAIAERSPNGEPPTLKFATIDERLAHLRWLGAMSDRLPKQSIEFISRIDFLETLLYESKRAGLAPDLMLGLVQVESGFRRYAISIVGARGYTQVMPFWARLIGDGDVARLFHMQTNLRFGCVILRHYLDREKGDLFLALGRYNGSRGRPEYPNAVFAAQRRWDVPPR